MGEEFTTNAPPVISVKLWGTDKFAKVQIIRDGEYVYSISPNTKTVDFAWKTAPRRKATPATITFAVSRPTASWSGAAPCGSRTSNAGEGGGAGHSHPNGASDSLNFVAFHRHTWRQKS